jgi:hypothetical protein
MLHVSCFLFPWVSMLDCMLGKPSRGLPEMQSRPVIRPARVKRQYRNPDRPSNDKGAKSIAYVHADIFHDAVSCFV